jgi:thermitase
MEHIKDYLSFIYPGTFFFLMLLFGILYVLRINRRKSIGLNVIFALVLLLYFVSFYKNYGWQPFVIIWLLRDAFLFAVFYLLLKFTVRNKVLVAVVFAGTFLILGLWYYQNGRLPFSKPQIDAFESASEAELFVQIKDKDRLGELSRLLEPYQARIQPAFPHLLDTAITELDDYYTIDFKLVDDTSTIVSKIENSGLVHYVEFNEVYTLSPIVPEGKPLDSISPYTFAGLNDPRINSQWAFKYLEIEKLLDVLKDAIPVKKARIFILDTGVDAAHEDLEGNYLSITKKYDLDTDRHGSHCAGIAGAVSNNSLGIASLNLTGKFTSITSVTVLPGGSGRQEGIIDGIILAADNGADVISMSLGGPSSDKRQRAYDKAIKYANDKGAILVVAAGNDNINARLAVPASCSGVITVAAVDDMLYKATFSNHVSDIEFKVCAPGVNILSTTPGNNYEFLNGTSMATPYVSGLIGLLKAFKPSLTTQEVFQILEKSGKETKNTNLTGKLIQPLAALNQIEIKSTQAYIVGFFDKALSFKADSGAN